MCAARPCAPVISQLARQILGKPCLPPSNAETVQYRAKKYSPSAHPIAARPLTACGQPPKVRRPAVRLADFRLGAAHNRLVGWPHGQARRLRPLNGKTRCQKQPRRTREARRKPVARPMLPTIRSCLAGISAMEFRNGTPESRNGFRNGTPESRKSLATGFPGSDTRIAKIAGGRDSRRGFQEGTPELQKHQPQKNPPTR